MYVCQISTPISYCVYYSIGVFWIGSGAVWCVFMLSKTNLHVLVVKDYIKGYHSKKITRNVLKNI